MPTWLRKWAALALEFVEAERQALPAALAHLPPRTVGTTDLEGAALGVEGSRVVNIVVTLDKVSTGMEEGGEGREAGE